MRHDRLALWARFLLFGALAAFGALQMLVTRVYSEPYPALYQPSFASAGAVGNVVVTVVPIVEATFRDGSTEEFEHSAIMEDVEVVRITAFNAVFRDDDRAHDVRTIAWLQRRLTDLSGGRQPASANIKWVRYEQTASDATRVAVELEDVRVIRFQS